MAYAYDLKTSQRHQSLDISSLRSAGNTSPQGMFSDGSTMWVADDADRKLYGYNMPSRAYLSSLDLSGVSFEQFSPRKLNYDLSAESGATAATVTAVAADPRATVRVTPADSDDNALNGHQVALDQDTDEISVTVTSGDVTQTYLLAFTANAPPVFASPTNQRAVNENSPAGTNVGLVVTATDADGDDADLVYRLSGGGGRFSIGESTGQISVAAGAVIDHEAQDSYELEVTAADEFDATARTTVMVTINDVNEAPTADAGANRNRMPMGTLVTLAGAGTDPDADDALTYAWSQTGGATVTLSNANTATVAFTAPSGLIGNHAFAFTLTVTDSGGLSHSDRVSVTVAGAVPLVAEMTAVPLHHDGTTSFEFDLNFSEKVVLTPETVRGSLLTVTGGSVTSAVRYTPGSNMEWVMTVTPSSDGDVELALSAGRACGATGAVCTSDGRMLSNSLELTVTGLPGPDVDDCTAATDTTCALTVNGSAFGAKASSFADVDWFSFTAEAGKNYFVDLGGARYLWGVYDSSGSRLPETYRPYEWGFGAPHPTNRQGFVVASAGKHYIAAKLPDWQGWVIDYSVELRTRSTDDFPASVATTGVVLVGGVDKRTGLTVEARDVEGTLEFSHDVDWVKAYLEQDVAYTVTLAADHDRVIMGCQHRCRHVRPQIIAIYDASGSSLPDTSDAPSSETDYAFDTATVQFTPTADGYYYISATGYRGDWGGGYAVSVSRPNSSSAPQQQADEPPQQRQSDANPPPADGVVPKEGGRTELEDDAPIGFDAKDPTSVNQRLFEIFFAADPETQ